MSGTPIQSAVDDALAGRRYRFSIHGRPDRRHRRRERSRSESARRGPYSITNPQQFAIGDFAAAENLMVAFRILRAEGGDAPGIDGLTYDDFSVGEIWAALRCVSSAIVCGTYRPYETRLVRIPKGDGRFRELRIMNILDRVVAKSLQLALAPYWESVLPGIRRSVWDIYAEMEQIIGQQRRFFLATDDIRDCFPSLRIEDVLRCHRQHINQPDLLRLVETVIRGQKGRDRTAGLDQGNPYSPPAAELALQTCLDHRWEAAEPGHPPLLRYVDNLQVLGNSAHEGQQALTTIQNTLEQHQLTMKGTDDAVVDIRNPEHGRNVLGLIPAWRKDLHFHLPEAAIQNLDDGLAEAMTKPNPPATGGRVVEGWIRAIGPVFVNTEAQDIVRRIMGITAKYGLREISRSQLLDVANQARDHWLKVRREAVLPTNGHRAGGSAQ